MFVLKCIYSATCMAGGTCVASSCWALQLTSKHVLCLCTQGPNSLADKDAVRLVMLYALRFEGDNAR